MPRRALIRVAVLYVVAHGAEAEAHPNFGTSGEVGTMVAAVGNQARVISKVKLKRESDDLAAVPAAPPVSFDKLTGQEQLSCTVGSFGAGGGGRSCVGRRDCCTASRC
jgi:hypothetical protein